MTLWRKVWKVWKTIAHRIGVFNSYLLLTIFYLFIMGPVSIFSRLAGVKWLTHGEVEKGNSTWVAKEPRDQTQVEYEKPY